MKFFSNTKTSQEKIKKNKNLRTDSCLYIIILKDKIK